MCFPDGETFPFSYDEISNRYGKDILEKDATVQVLATPDQVKEMARLIDLIKVPEEVSQKWLDKNDAETWEEMPVDAIQKCIDHLKSKIQGDAA